MVLLASLEEASKEWEEDHRQLVTAIRGRTGHMGHRKGTELLDKALCVVCGSPQQAQQYVRLFERFEIKYSRWKRRLDPGTQNAPQFFLYETLTSLGIFNF